MQEVELLVGEPTHTKELIFKDQKGGSGVSFVLQNLEVVEVLLPAEIAFCVEVKCLITVETDKQFSFAHEE